MTPSALRPGGQDGVPSDDVWTFDLPCRHHQDGTVEADAHPLPDGRSGGHGGRHAAGRVPHGDAEDPPAEVGPETGRRAPSGPAHTP